MRPVCLAIRASILGPSSSLSWKAKITLGEPSFERVLWEPEVRLTIQPMRRRAARTLRDLVALNRSGSGGHDERDVRRLFRCYLAVLELLGDRAQGQGLDLLQGLLVRSAVDLAAGDRLDESDPAAVLFPIEVNFQSHGRRIAQASSPRKDAEVWCRNAPLTPIPRWEAKTPGTSWSHRVNRCRPESAEDREGAGGRRHGFASYFARRAWNFGLLRSGSQCGSRRRSGGRSRRGGKGAPRAREAKKTAIASNRIRLAGSEGAFTKVPSPNPASGLSPAQATFGFVVRCCPATGNLGNNDHQADVRIKAQSVNGLSISSPGTSCPAIPGSRHATFTGTASVIRSAGTTTESFRVDVDDCGEPGSADTFGIKTTTYSNGPSTLIGGNIQIHN